MKKIFFLFLIIPFANLFAQDTLLYKIDKGENLYKISKVYEVSIADLMAMNGLESDVLKIEQTLKIYIRKELTEAKIALNTSLYHKENFESKITANEAYLKQNLILLNEQSAKLNIEKDIQKKFEISRQKSILEDSIKNENNLLNFKIDKCKNEIDSIKTLINVDTSVSENQDVIQKTKSKEEIRLEIENRILQLKEKEEAKKIADKQKEKEKKEREKAKKKATKEKELAKKSALKTKEKEKKDKEKAKKLALKEKEKAKKLAASGKEPKNPVLSKEEKEKSIAKETKAKQTTEEKVEKLEEVAKKEKEKPIAKETKAKETTKEKVEKLEEVVKKEKEKPIAKETKVKETTEEKVEKIEEVAKEEKEKPIAKEAKTEEIIAEEVEKDLETKIEFKEKKLETLDAKDLDSLKELRNNNLVYLEARLKSIEEEKASLNIDLDLQRILFLSKEKFLVTDSINKLNAILDLQIPNLNKEEKPLKPQPKEIKEVKIEKPLEETLAFDNTIKIDTTVFTKEIKEKLIADEKVKTNIQTKDTSAVKINATINPVIIENTKKKTKFVIGDVVDKQLQEKAKFFLARAKLEIDKGNISKASDYIDKSIDLNPSYAEAYMLKGDIFSSMTFYEKALGNYGRASYLEPKNAQVNYNLGNCYIRLGKDNLAIEQWTKAINNDSTYILAYAGRASLFMKNKNFEAAIKDYNKIFSINKYFYEAYKGRGVAFLELGNYGKAIIDFNNYLAYEPNDDFVFWKRGLAKLSDNEIYGGCIDLLSSSDLGNKEAEKALRKHCEK